jgi:hypothetical protein
VDKRRSIAQTILEILSQATTPIEPRQRAFYDPALGEDHKALGLVTPGDELALQLGAQGGQHGLNLRALIRPIRA